MHAYIVHELKGKGTDSSADSYLRLYKISQMYTFRNQIIKILDGGTQINN